MESGLKLMSGLGSGSASGRAAVGLQMGAVREWRLVAEELEENPAKGEDVRTWLGWELGLGLGLGLGLELGVGLG